MDTITTILLSASIPSAIVGFLFWLIKRKIQKREDERAKRDERQEALQLIILDSVNGSINLAEATARAIQRIPDAQCNGDMHAALEAMERTKVRQQRLIMEAGIHNLINE